MKTSIDRRVHSGGPGLGALIAALVLTSPAYAQHGVDDNRVSLPDGPGSLEGVGENIGFNPNMGSMSWSVPIQVTPGFAGVTPELALSYDSGRGSGVVGVGWDLMVPHVERMTYRGLPEYDTEDDFAGAGEQLIRVAEDGEAATYRARFEKGFVRWTWRDRGDGDGGSWVAEYPDGRVGYFGAGRDGVPVPSARVVDPIRGGVFRYHLVELYDVFDHRLEYTYRKNTLGPGRDGVVSLVQSAGYVFADGANPAYEVTFLYEPRADETGGAALSDAKPGFDERLTERLSEISVFSRGERIRRYRLSYEDYADSGGFTRLSRVETVGHRDGVYPIAFDFTYSRALGGVCDEARCDQPFMVDMGSVGEGFDGGRVNLVDINGDGLPDVVRSPVGENHRFYINTIDPGELGDAGGVRSGFADAPVVSDFGADFDLSAPGVQMVDGNGDGFADLLNTRTGVALFNRGAGDWADRGEVNAGGLPVFDGRAGQPRFLDVDNDKRIDVVTSTSEDTQVLRNLGDRFAGLGDVQAIEAGFADDGLQFADMNGDGLLDPVRVRPGVVDYRLNLGWGRWSGWRTIEDAPIQAGEAGLVSLEDLNGDALADIVLVVGSEVRYAINRNGERFLTRRTLTSQRVDGEIPVRDDRVSVLFADMNANGSNDVVWVDRDGGVQYLELFPVRPNLLSRIENGIGMVMDITYGTSAVHRARAAAAGEPWQNPLPHPMLVVDRTDTWDRLSEVHEVDAYRYRDGFYDGVEKQFRGYARVDTELQVGDDGTHEPGARVQIFDVGAEDVYRKGLALESRTTSGGRALSVERMTHGDCPVDGIPPAEALDLPVRYICHQATETVHQEGADPSEWRTVRAAYAYDGYGNQVRTEMHGVVAVGDGDCAPCDRPADVFGAPCGGACLGDELFTETDFIEPGAATNGRWIIHAPWRARTFGRRGGPSKEVITYYDGDAFEGLPAGQLDQALPTRVTAKINDGAEDVIQQVRNAFDDDGNVIDTLDPLGEIDGTTHRRRYTYDDEGLRVVQTDILLEAADGTPYRLRRETQYEPLFDKVSESTAWLRVAGGAVQSSRRSSLFAYDEFGRIVSLVRPGGDTLQNPTRVFAYELASPVSRVITRSRSQVGGQLDLESIRCVDGRSREVQTRTRIERGRYQVTGFTRYNQRSAPVEAYQPYVGDDGQCDEAPPAGVLARRYRYDAIHRAVGMIEPDDGIYGTATETRTAYAPLATIAFDGEDTDPQSPHADTPTIQRTDGLGRLVAIERTLVAGEDPPTYTLRYDTLGRLRGYIDPAGHEKVQSFDLLDRLVSIDGPNSGRTEFDYDDAGNVVEERDARGFIIRKAYDGANRLAARWEAADEDGTRVEWTYDVAPAGCGPEECTFPEGQLSGVVYPGLDGEVGADHVGRDIRDRPVFTRRTIEGFDYAFTMTYDNADRLVSTTYPDGSDIARVYDDASRLVEIPGVVDAIEYTARDQQARMACADGTVATWSYDDRMRLDGCRVDGDAGVLQGFEYTRDRVGHLLTVADAGLDDGGPRTDAAYGHDAWYRLVRAEVNGVNGMPETLSYSFDTIDNLLSRTSSVGAANPLPQGDFEYGANGAGPNAVTAAGALTLAYDDAGYAIERAGRDLDWDYLGRLVGVDATARYAYASGPDRVAKVEDGSRTHYPLLGFDVRDGISALYVRVGRKRVARLESDALATALMPDGNGNDIIDAGDALLAAGAGDDVDGMLWSSARRQLLETGDEAAWLHHDHLGSVTLTTADGEARGRRGFYPTGTDRGAATGYVDDYGFTGQEHDRTGLVRFQWRYLDPQTGRWASVDPAFRAAAAGLVGRLGESTTAYAYAANRWSDAIDPTGLMVKGGGGAAVAGGGGGGGKKPGPGKGGPGHGAGGGKPGPGKPSKKATKPNKGPKSSWTTPDARQYNTVTKDGKVHTGSTVRDSHIGKGIGRNRNASREATRTMQKHGLQRKGGRRNVKEQTPADLQREQVLQQQHDGLSQQNQQTPEFYNSTGSQQNNQMTPKDLDEWKRFVSSFGPDAGGPPK